MSLHRIVAPTVATILLFAGTAFGADEHHPPATTAQAPPPAAPTVGAAGPPEGTERAFQERADLAEAAQGGLAAGGVPIGGHGMVFHIGSIKAY